MSAVDVELDPPVPHGQEALDLFDGLRLLAGTTSFAELERARNGPPDAG